MKKLSLLKLAIISGACAAASAVLRTVSLLGFTDTSGYYKSHPIPIIASLIFGLSLLFIGAAAIFFIKKNESVDIPNKTAGIAALLPIGALAFHAIIPFPSITKHSANQIEAFFSATNTIQLYVVIFSVLSIEFFVFAAMIAFKRKANTAIAYVIATLLPIGALAFHAISQFITTTENGLTHLNTNKSFAETLVERIPFFTIIFAALSIAFFVLISVIAFKKKPITAIAYVGLIPLIYVILLWASTHFDFLIPLNSANKTFFFLACASALLFIYNEIAACCKLMLRSKFYYFSLFAAIITLSTASIPSVIAYLSGSLGRYFSLEGDLFFITVLIYATVRLITLITEQRKAPVIEEESEASKNDTAEIAEEASEHLDETSEEKAE